MQRKRFEVWVVATEFDGLTRIRSGLSKKKCRRFIKKTRYRIFVVCPSDKAPPIVRPCVEHEVSCRSDRFNVFAFKNDRTLMFQAKLEFSRKQCARLVKEWFEDLSEPLVFVQGSLAL